MEIDRQWPQFDDFIIELGDERSASTQRALQRIHAHVVDQLAGEFTRERFIDIWPALMDQLPPSRAQATRYLSVLRRFAAVLGDALDTDDLAQAQQALDVREAQRSPDAWANELHPRFGWKQVEPTTTIEP